MKFKKGDRVIGVKDYDGMRLVGVKGTVAGEGEKIIMVCWDPKFTEEEYGCVGHDCVGLCEYGHGWWVKEDCIKHLEDWVGDWE